MNDMIRARIPIVAFAGLALAVPAAAQESWDFTLTLRASEIEYRKTEAGGGTRWETRNAGSGVKAIVGYRQGGVEKQAAFDLLAGNASLGAAAKPGEWVKAVSFTAPRVRVYGPSWNSRFVADPGVAVRELTREDAAWLDSGRPKILRFTSAECPLAPFELECAAQAWSKSADGKGLNLLTLRFRLKKDDPAFEWVSADGRPLAKRAPPPAARAPAAPGRPSAIRPAPAPSLKTPAAWNSALFADALYRKAGATYDDGVRVAAMLVTGQEAGGAYEPMRDDLIRRGVLLADWAFPADEPLTRGEVAVLVSGALGIKGGAAMRIFGPNRRTATKACQEKGIVLHGSPYDRVSGRELLGTFQRAREYAAGGRVTTVD